MYLKYSEVLILYSVPLFDYSNVSLFYNLLIRWRNIFIELLSTVILLSLSCVDFFFFFFSDQSKMNLSFFSLLPCFCGLADFTSIMSSLPGKSRFYDVKTCVKITQIASKYVMESRSVRKAAQIAQILASLFGCDSARLMRDHVILPRLFRPFWQEHFSSVRPDIASLPGCPI